MIGEQHRELVLGLRFTHVIEFALQVARDLGRELRSRYRRDRRAPELQEHRQVLHVGTDRNVDTRALHLDCDVATAVQTGAANLARRRRGHGLVIDILAPAGRAACVAAALPSLEPRETREVGTWSDIAESSEPSGLLRPTRRST